MTRSEQNTVIMFATQRNYSTGVSDVQCRNISECFLKLLQNKRILELLMFTKEQINEILRPWDSSMDERPTPTTEDYAYDKTDREKAWMMAHDWQEPHIVMMDDDETMEDFICHQSDVIEMLAHALSFANKKLLGKEQITQTKD